MDADPRTADQKVAQDTIDRVCAGGGSQSERDAVWNYIQSLQREVNDLRVEVAYYEGKSDE